MGEKLKLLLDREVKPTKYKKNDYRKNEKMAKMVQFLRINNYKSCTTSDVVKHDNIKLLEFHDGSDDCWHDFTEVIVSSLCWGSTSWASSWGSSGREVVVASEIINVLMSLQRSVGEIRFQARRLFRVGLG